MPEVHIHVRLASTFPSARDLASRDALELALHAGVGDVLDVDAGRGCMDVYVRVERAEVVIARIEHIVEALGLTGRTDVVFKGPTIASSAS